MGDAPSNEASGLFAFLLALLTGVFGWLGKLAWDKRPKTSHGYRHEFDELRELLAREEVDRAQFRARIEATMVTKDDLHKEVSAFRDHSDAQASKLHERLDAHVMAYHKT